MTNKDFVDMNRQPELLPDYLADPEKRKAFEREKAAQFEAQQNKAQQQAPQAVQKYEQELLTGTERVFLVNNKARPIHINDEGIIIDGQLSVSAQGPFLQISKEKFEQSYQLQTYLEKPVSRENPHLRGVMCVEQLNENEYKRRYRDYLSKRTLRQAEYAKEHNNVARHEDGTIDEEDAAFEVRKINKSIVRAQG